LSIGDHMHEKCNITKPPNCCSYLVTHWCTWQTREK